MPNVGFLSAFPIIAIAAAVVGVGIFAYQEYMGRHSHEYTSQNFEERPVSTPPRRRNPRRINDRRRNADCSICLESLNNTHVQYLVCGHMFHQGCIERWFNEDRIKSCPNCRRRDR
ncbi:uncharacterized protein LOC142325192 [Lycorma delicatula]|uniref:uncharacterized protein LOC142325192 n=1 Tax=Lycorma delicatula TaxID=130591 RepID=UPI003F5188B2